MTVKKLIDTVLDHIQIKTVQKTGNPSDGYGILGSLKLYRGLDASDGLKLTQLTEQRRKEITEQIVGEMLEEFYGPIAMEVDRIASIGDVPRMQQALADLSRELRRLER